MYYNDGMKKFKRQSGQTLVEFILLLAAMFVISFAMLRGFNWGVGNIWQIYVEAIAIPTDSDISFD